jgi:putative acetyltransferase
VNIRAERTDDVATIRGVLISAFPGPAEADLVERLRANRELMLSLVAELEGTVCGYVAFPRLVVESAGEGADAAGLAPLAVSPQSHRCGIGSLLVREGLRLLDAQGLPLVFVLGDPAYYARFGFDPAAARSFDSPYSGTHFMALRLSENAPRGGKVRYPAAFDQRG